MIRFADLNPKTGKVKPPKPPKKSDGARVLEAFNALNSKKLAARKAAERTGRTRSR